MKSFRRPLCGATSSSFVGLFVGLLVGLFICLQNTFCDVFKGQGRGQAGELYTALL